MLTLRVPPPRLLANVRPAAPSDLAALLFEQLWRHWSLADRAMALGLAGAGALWNLGASRPQAWRYGWNRAEDGLLIGDDERHEAHLGMAARKGAHRLLNPGAYPLETNPLKNKRLFAARVRAAGLAAPKTFLGSPEALPRWLAGENAVVAKPNFASKGIGIRAFRRDEPSWRMDLEVVSDECAVEAMQGLLGRGWLLQRSCPTHPALADLSPGALPTLRVMTAVGLDGAVAAYDRVIRLSAGGGRPVDNFNAGNVVAAVDDEGRIGRAFRRKAGRVIALDRHPATGRRLAGRDVPDLEAAAALAVRAHETFREGFRIVGWDVGLTAEGPALIEGNWNPGTDILRLVSGRGLGETPLGGVYRELLLALPSETWRMARPIQFEPRHASPQTHSSAAALRPRG